MTAILWALPSGILATWLEVGYRKGWTWDIGNLWFVIPLAMTLNYTVYRTITAGPTLLVAVAAFSGTALLMRVAASHFVLGEEVVKGNLLAGVFMFVAVVVGTLWR